MEFNLKIPCTKEEIKSEISVLRKLREQKQSEMNLINVAIQHYQKQCDHKGQRTGCNERDGSWGAPCPTCGYSY